MGEWGDFCVCENTTQDHIRQISDYATYDNIRTISDNATHNFQAM